jgi:membrane fusion protein
MQAEDGEEDRSSVPLFRQEALDAAGSRRFGTVLLARPLGHALLTAFFAAIAVGLIAFFAFFGITRKVQVSGVLLPTDGLIRLVATQSGIVERRVAEGQAVRRGAVLFVLTSERAGGSQGDADATIAALLQARRTSLVDERAQARLQARQRDDASRRRMAELDAEIERIAAQIALQQRRVALGEAAVRRYADLADAHFVSPAQVQDRQVELLDQRQRLGELERARAAIGRERSTQGDGLRDARIQAQREQEAAERSIAAIEQDLAENEVRRRTEVRAPRDGIVTAITADPGQSVGANQVLATLLPAEAELEAELYVPSRAAGFLRPGMPVLVRYQAYAYQKFGPANGTVREVSHTAMRPQDFSLPVANASGEPQYRVRVRLARQTVAAYGTDQPLRSGALLDASILLEQRRLYEWVLDPLYTITGRT